MRSRVDAIFASSAGGLKRLQRTTLVSLDLDVIVERAERVVHASTIPFLNFSGISLPPGEEPCGLRRWSWTPIVLNPYRSAATRNISEDSEVQIDLLPGVRPP